MRVPSQLLRQRVQVQDRGENTGDGATYGDEWTLRCRVDWSQKLARGPEGEDITVVGVLVIRPGRYPDTGARVTVDGDVRTVAAVTPIFGPGARLAGRTVLLQ